MKKLSYQNYLLGIFLISLCGVLGSFFAQYVLKLVPCPLCIFQRVSVMGVCACSFILLLLWLIFKWRGTFAKVLASLIISMPAGFGFFIAARHIHLQSLPASEVPACGPGLNFLIDTLPFTEVLNTVLNGAGECAEVKTILMVPLPIWSIILFSLILLISWLAVFRSAKY